MLLAHKFLPSMSLVSRSIPDRAWLSLRFDIQWRNVPQQRATAGDHIPPLGSKLVLFLGDSTDCGSWEHGVDNVTVNI